MDFCYNLLKEANREFPLLSDSPVWMLGKCYEPLTIDEEELQQENQASSSSPYSSPSTPHRDALAILRNRKRFAHFVADYQSRLWFTYRKDFPNIEPSYFTSDAGWGCMLRSGQMLLAQALQFHLLGRDWRLTSPLHPLYEEIIGWFADYPSPICPYSIHNIAQLGVKYGKNVGEWFGPSTIAQVLEDLVMEENPSDLKMYVSSDGCIYLDQIRDICTPKAGDEDPDESHWHSLLILIPLRLGLDVLNADYFPALKATFRFPQSLGIIGGRPRSSLYFIGYQDDYVFYLDPHTVQPVVPPKERRDLLEEIKRTKESGTTSNPSSSSDEDDNDENDTIHSYISVSYHCYTPHKMHISEVDPSLAVAFYCKDKAAFEDFCERAQNRDTWDGMMIFNMEESTPEYLVKKKPTPMPREKLFSDDEDDVVFL